MSREMKDSGIPWIGEIPKGWKVSKLKHLATDKDSLIIDGDWIESNVIEASGIRYLTTGNIGDGVFKEQGQGYISRETFDALNCTMVYAGDLVFSRLNYPMGRSCIIPEVYDRCIVAVDNVIFRPNKDVSKKYLMYVSMCTGFQNENALIARGATMQRMSRGQLVRVFVPIPDTNTQQRIAEFLDKKCSEIDSLIELQEQMIEELKAYKQSVITEAVTKGIRNEELGVRNYKDSGIEWIGDVPEEWEVCKLKYFTLKIGSGSTPTGGSEVYVNDGVKFLRSQNVYFEGLLLDDVVYISDEIDENMKGTRVLEGDVLLNITGGSIGRCFYVDSTLGRANVNQHVSIIRPYNSNTKYIKYYLQSYLGQYQVKQLQTGGNREGLSAAAIKDFRFINCPLAEQQAIADYLDKKCGEIDELITIKQQKIEGLKEYKKSVIYEYVTGKREP